jgi:membrane associated rhomboid family serine protease
MGIYDREYYRGETAGSGWLTGLAPCCKALILVNAVVFVVENLLKVDPVWISEWLAASPEGIFHNFRVWQLITATFLHSDPFHILFNMAFLWIVGREMESLYGSEDFLAFYLGAGMISTLGWAAIMAFSGSPAYMVGASGAVLGVITLYTLYYPRREISIYFLFPVQAWLALSIYLVFDLLFPRLREAYQAHLIGAAFAVCYKHFDLRWSRLVGGQLRRPKLRMFTPVQVDWSRPRPSAGSSRPSGEGKSTKSSAVSVLPEEQLDARLDEVLAKIAREGRTGLTEEDQRVLQEASRRARNKRSDRL